MAMMGHLFWVFFHAIVWSLILVSLFWNVNEHLGKRLGGRKTLAALTTLTLVLLLVCWPGAYFIALLSEEAYGFYQRTAQNTDVVSTLMGFIKGDTFAGRIRQLATMTGFEITSSKLLNFTRGSVRALACSFTKDSALYFPTS